MARFHLIISNKAEDDILALDPVIRDRITRKLRFFISQENPLRFAERLTEAIVGHYRFRVGDYRVLFYLQPNGVITILLILRVKHRRDAYD